MYRVLLEIKKHIILTCWQLWLKPSLRSKQAQKYEPDTQFQLTEMQVRTYGGKTVKEEHTQQIILLKQL